MSSNVYSCFYQVYIHLDLFRRDFQKCFCYIHDRWVKIDWKYSGKQLSTGLILHACCSQVVILYVHHLNLAEKFFYRSHLELDISSDRKYHVIRITTPYLSSFHHRWYSTHVSTISSMIPQSTQTGRGGGGKPRGPEVGKFLTRGNLSLFQETVG